MLLVEDDEDWAELIRHMVRDAPFPCEFIAVSNADTALAQLSDADWDVALLDYRLGPSTAIELMRAPGFVRAGVPAIVLTNDERPYAEALAAGAVDYLVKSELTAVLLHRAIRYAVERQRIADDRRRVEVQQAHLASIVEFSDDAIFSRTLDGHILTWNAGAERLYGYSTVEAIGQHVRMLIADEVHHRLPAIFDTIRAGGSVRQWETLSRDKNGRSFPVVLTISPTRDLEGRVNGAATVARDITEQKRFQTALAESEAELSHIFNLSPDMLCTANAQGYLTRTNATWQRVLGYPEVELLSTPFLAFVHPDDQQATLAELERLARGEVTFGFTNRYRTVDGHYRWIEWHAQADTSAGVIYAVARDQTERRLLEQQLRQAQKMDAIGQLAGGVAHDFNNILTAIHGFTEFALERVAAGDPVERDLREVVKACDRASTLTRQLLAFSRKQMLAAEVLDLGVVVNRMTAMLARIIGEDIALSIRSAPGLGVIHADRGQIEQVLLNLAVNARDAMPSGGKLAIEVANVELDDMFISRHPGSAAGPHVALAVSDTGCGMTEEVKSRMFEPFFTTKEAGKGSGLGLSTVYGIIKQSGGSIWVYSEVGVGSSIKIYLPRTDAVTTAAASPQSTSEALDGTETILVVEDQAEVRQVAESALRRRGYTVLSACGATDAEARIDAHPGVVHLLLTDVVMPESSGRDLAERLCRRHPHLRVLYMSGYTDDAVVRRGVLSREMAFLEKPFTAKGLLRAVRGVLDGR